LSPAGIEGRIIADAKGRMSESTWKKGSCGMSSAPLFFEFDQERDALLALDTLEELGYEPRLLSETSKPTLHIHVEGQDLTSALEIAQAHGGRLVEGEQSQLEAGVYAMAYDMEGSIRIPAHIVNEDWAEGYADSTAYQSVEAGDDDGAFDPSTDEYNHFQPGVRL
jgi:hypothetical protein